MAKIKRGWINIVLAIIILVLAVVNTYFLYTHFYSNFPQIQNILDTQILLGSRTVSIFSLTVGVQLILLIIIELLLIGNYKKKQKEGHFESSYSKIKESHGRFNTDLDALFDLIKNNKEVKIDYIVKTFKISPEMALEWAKILENNDLVTIEYPAFSSPVILIKQKNE